MQCGKCSLQVVFPKASIQGATCVLHGGGSNRRKSTPTEAISHPQKAFSPTLTAIRQSVSEAAETSNLLGSPICLAKSVWSLLLRSPKCQAWKLCCGGHVLLVYLDPVSGFFFNTNSRVHDALIPRLLFQGRKPQTDFLHTCGFSELFGKDVLPAFIKCLGSTCPQIPPDKAV